MVSELKSLGPIQLVSLALVVNLAACGDDGGGADADAGVADAAGDASIADAALPDADLTPDAAVLPQRLEDTGLYSDFAGQLIASDVYEYVPAHPLWTDGAVKRRWVQFPDGASIDTTDMDFWEYPEGTKMWKEFATPEGLKLETRFIWKNGPSAEDWFYTSYAWNQEQDQTVAVPNGQQNVLGTEFDIPALGDCRKCHQRQPDFVLGFSAIELDHSQPGVNLGTLIADNRLSNPPTGEAPYFALPGDELDRQVLGYIHGNCGGCHHADSDVQDTTNLILRLEVDSLGSLGETPMYSTTVGVAPLLSVKGATSLIEPSDPDASAIFIRMNNRGNAVAMPPRGTELVDSDALLMLSEWISRMEEK